MSNFKFHRVCERKSGRERDCASFGEALRKKYIHYSAISFQCKRCQFYKFNISQLVMNILRSISLSFVFVVLLLVPMSSLNVNNQILIGVQISPRITNYYGLCNTLSYPFFQQSLHIGSSQAGHPMRECLHLLLLFLPFIFL